jgi:hypothetical protein
MAATKRRSPTSTLVSKDSISSASYTLQDLPEKPKEIWSLREAINLLKEQISTALDRGYTYTEVSRMLTETGVEISPSTLKYYLSSARKDDPSKPRTRRRRRMLGVSADALANGISNGAGESRGMASQDSDDEEEPVKTTRRAPRATAASRAKPAAKAKPASTRSAPKATATRTRRKAT